MNVEKLLQVKGVDPIIVGPKQTITEVAGLLAERNKGLALVCDVDGKLLGVVSVMDISRAVAEHAEQAPGMAVERVMTRNLCLCEPGESVDDVLVKLIRNRLRHLPVVEDGSLKGLLNLRTVLQHLIEESEIQADELRKYIYGVGYH